jgi:hypothetical protein
MDGSVPGLLAPAARTARTRMTSTNSPCDAEGGHPGAVGAGAHPGTPRTPTPGRNGHEAKKRTPVQSVARPQATGAQR